MVTVTGAETAPALPSAATWLGWVLAPLVAVSVVAAPASARVPSSTTSAANSPDRPAVRAVTSAKLSNGRLVALSFDDGPDPRWTPGVLALLDRHGAHAAFFAVGRNVAAHPELVRAELAAGNEVGDHTYDHADLSRLGRQAVAVEIDRGAQALEAAGAPPPRLFRPPYGRTNAVVARAAAMRSYRTVLWSLSLEHFVNHASRPSVAVDRMLARVRPGTVILAHDGGIPDRSRTMAALPLLLQRLQARGYRVVGVSDLLDAATRPSVDKHARPRP